MYISEIELTSNKVILADLGMENAALHDVEVLQRFIASRYQSIQRIEIHRLSEPQNDFTGSIMPKFHSGKTADNEESKLRAPPTTWTLTPR